MLKLGTSGVLVRDHKVLLGLRNPYDEALPNMWCTPGGGIEPGESTIDACRREFREEVGLDVSINDAWTCVCETSKTVLIFRKVEASPFDEPKALDGFSAVRWFTWSEIRQLSADGKITPMTYGALWDFDNKNPFWLNPSI